MKRRPLCPAREALNLLEDIVRNRDGRFHTESITLVEVAARGRGRAFGRMKC